MAPQRQTYITVSIGERPGGILTSLIAHRGAAADITPARNVIAVITVADASALVRVDVVFLFDVANYQAASNLQSGLCVCTFVRVCVFLFVPPPLIFRLIVS